MQIFVKPIFCSELEKPLKQHLAEMFVISFLAIPMGYFFCQQCYEDLYLFFLVYVLGGAIWVSQWKGHSFLNDFLDTKISWFESPGKRSFFTLIVLLTYTPISLSVVHYFVELLFGINTQYFTREGFIRMNTIAIGIGGAITLFSFSSHFLKNWRQAEINAEKLRAENISSQFEALKNQVNPHFLFNSLNVLTSLVYHDQDKAALFIKRLSDVYRYVLEQKGNDLVNLGKELDFVKSYLFLQKIRFGDNLKIDIGSFAEGIYNVAPLSVQMLVENAIKHNVISKEDPLDIKITFTEQGQLVVSNNLQKKNVIEGESQGIGLENIKQRYAYLTDGQVVVEKENGQFTVKIPLIVAS